MLLVNHSQIPVLTRLKAIANKPAAFTGTQLNKNLKQDTVSFSSNALQTLNVQKTLQKVEQEIHKKPEEIAVIIDSKTGQEIERSKGRKDGTDLDPELIKGNIFTHNHPTEGVDITLSEADIIAGITSKAKEIRAVTPDGMFFSFELPDNLTDDDSAKLMDIMLETLFDNEEYVIVRQMAKLDDEGNYLNSKEELGFISAFTDVMWQQVAQEMQSQGYDVKYDIGNI